MVAIKVAAVLFVIAVGAFYVGLRTVARLAPLAGRGSSFFGILSWGSPTRGVSSRRASGGAIIFFAYIGCRLGVYPTLRRRRTQSATCRSHHGPLLVCTVLYIGVVAC